MTVAMLMSNTLQSAERLWIKARERRIKPLKLDILEKVPRFGIFRSDQLVSEYFIQVTSKLLWHKHRSQLPNSHLRSVYNPTSWKAMANTRQRSNLVSSSVSPIARMVNILLSPGMHFILRSYMKFNIICAALPQHRWAKANLQLPLALHKH